MVPPVTGGHLLFLRNVSRILRQGPLTLGSDVSRVISRKQDEYPSKKLVDLTFVKSYGNHIFYKPHLLVYIVYGINHVIVSLCVKPNYSLAREVGCFVYNLLVKNFIGKLPYSSVSGRVLWVGGVRTTRGPELLEDPGTFVVLSL